MRRFVLAAATLTASFALAGPATAADQPAAVATPFTLAGPAMQPVMVSTYAAEPAPEKAQQPQPSVKRASSVDVL